MIKPNFIANILLPDTIEQLGMNKIYEVQRLGGENHYRLHLTTNALSHDIPAFQPNLANNRMHEIADKSRVSKGLSDLEKNLLKSELRFPNEEILLFALEKQNISKEDITELNSIIKEVQESYIKYTFTIINLEQKTGLDYDQVTRIMKLTPALINNNYELNAEDKKYYRHAQFFTIQLKESKLELDEKLTTLFKNDTFNSLVRLSQDHYCLKPHDVSIIINKINTIMVINPEKLLSSEEMQKKYSK